MSMLTVVCAVLALATVPSFSHVSAFATANSPRLSTWAGVTRARAAALGVRGGSSVAATAGSAEEVAAAALGKNVALLNAGGGASRAALVSELLSLGQEHLFEGWPAPGTADDRKRALLDALARCNEQYPGGLRSYVTKARELLASSARGDNPFEGWRPSVPEGELLEFGTPAFDAAEKVGAAAAAGAAFVIVAGGLGERLGYEGIKLSLPSEITTGASYLQLYVE